MSGRQRPVSRRAARVQPRAAGLLRGAGVAGSARPGWGIGTAATGRLIPRDGRGASTVELAVLAPALMLISMLIIQFGLWFNARQAALAAAQAGAMVARQDAAGDPGWARAAELEATGSYRQLDIHLLGNLTARAYGDPRTSVYVKVSGPLGYSVIPFFRLNLTVSATAGGPVECFRPADHPGSC